MTAMPATANSYTSDSDASSSNDNNIVFFDKQKPAAKPAAKTPSAHIPNCSSSKRKWDQPFHPSHDGNWALLVACDARLDELAAYFSGLLSFRPNFLTSQR